MKKTFAVLMVLLSVLAFSQKTPAKTKKKPLPPHQRHATVRDRESLRDGREAPPKPPSPKELFQKMKEGKKKADAKREQDMKEMDRNAPR